jgi:hypothetical protein
MKSQYILLRSVFLGLCLGVSVWGTEQTVLKKITPPPGFERVENKPSKSVLQPVSNPQGQLDTESSLDPIEIFNPQNEPDPRPFTPPRHYLCLRTDKPIIIDGRFNEAAWQKTLWSEAFTDIRAPYGASQPVPLTKFKMLWDDEYLYVAVVLSEYNIRATQTQRDNPESVDFDLEMYIDADADSQQYSVLKINAFNALQSLVYNRPPKDGGIARMWPIQGLQHAVFVEGTINNPDDRDKSWQVEMAIPLAMPALLGGVSKIPADGEIWRVNFARIEWRKKLVLSADRGNDKPEELAATEKLIRCCWTPQGVINMHRPETWGYIQFHTQFAGSPADFEPDPTEWARYALHRVLYAQKWYHLNFGAYADSLNALGLDKTPPMFATEPIQIQTGPDSFLALVNLRLPDMSMRTLSIDNNAKITLKPK